MSFLSFDDLTVTKGRRGQGSAAAAASKRQAEPSSDSSDSEETAAESKGAASAGGKAKRAKKERFEPVDELISTAESLKTTGELLRRFIGSCMQEWAELKGEDSKAATPEGDEIGAPPAASQLQPLVELALAKTLGKEEDEKLRKTCMLSLTGEHLQAQQAYIELVIGSAKWPIGGMSYISSDAPTGKERCWGQKQRTIEQKGSLLDNDSVRVALQGFKRLLSYVSARKPGDKKA